MLELVESYGEVLENVRAFHKGLGAHGQLAGTLGYFRHWYYFEEFDTFAPSKFVGYRGMTSERYLADYHKLIRVTGDDTVRQLKQWFYLCEGDEREQYMKKLAALLNLYGKKPNGILFIYRKTVIGYEQLSF
ncbi:MAG TPA: hypothetical protein PL044_06670 [Clostridiales bacterium]|nr:MAG: hypothetical protein BWY37_00699 [Firmicutes bacterium ADurb.Bin262]HOU09303.1 hypothetical protein [Clostridiales bacterium]HQH63754.1 hypothetical protein [Clostridiales bacterium]HQK73441.1 hypothetical protein [Clostridiales bacterium]